MATLLRVVGAIWAIIGAWNLVAMPWTEPDKETLLGIGLIFNMLLFILPGLVVYGIGTGITKRRSAQTIPPTQQPAPSIPQQDKLTAEERLSKLSSLKDKGLINGDEYEVRRKEIIDEI